MVECHLGMFQGHGIKYPIINELLKTIIYVINGQKEIT